MSTIRLYTIFLFSIFLISGCSNDNASNSDAAAAVVTFPESGLLGKEITIEIANIPVGNLQVFFDYEEAEIDYFSQEAIKVTVPRALTTSTSHLKVIDLTKNKTILDEVFGLKTPVISGLSSGEATFDEVFSLYGENFDDVNADVKVYVNNEPAFIEHTAYNEIQVKLPYNITGSDLQVKVNAQRQDVTAPVALHLRNPQITSVNSQPAGVWLGTQLLVNGLNFNPNQALGIVKVNGVITNFSATNNMLMVDIPIGPFNTFEITNITYTTAGMTTSFNTNLPIRNDGIMVDYDENVGRGSSVFFEHNNKAYHLTFINELGDNTMDYRLFEFSPATEKWSQSSAFAYNGWIADAVFDGNNSLYLYKNLPNGTFVLTKLDMDTFTESNIPLPENRIFHPLLFAFQEKLYLLSGLNIINGVESTRTEKYVYSEATNSWSSLSSSALSEIPLVATQGGSGKCIYVHKGSDIYVSVGQTSRTYKITSGLAVSIYYPFYPCFVYQNAVIGDTGLSNMHDLYNIVTGAYLNVQDGLFGNYGSTFFTLNNEVYFTKGTGTHKLRKTILNGIL